MAIHEYTAVIEKRGKWYVGYVEEIPGVNTEGRTKASVRRNLRDALRMILAANRSLARRRKANGAIREQITVRV